MVDFAGWEMPMQYSGGIVAEHLATRRRAGLFDVSHMGRFVLRGPGTVPVLQYVLTNNVEALDLLQAQYTIVPSATGGAIDDAYLYRFHAEEYLLVVNASNRIKDLDHLREQLEGFPGVELTDETGEIAMLAVQGRASRDILATLIQDGRLPQPWRNELSVVTMGGASVLIGRTGYTGEPVCFELFVAAQEAPRLWDALVAEGAQPVGLGARDTLRLEAGLPLYGHELGIDPAGDEIPVMSCPLATFAVSFSPRKGGFIGRAALERQHTAYARILRRDFSRVGNLPKLTRHVAVTGRGIARASAEVYREGERVGWVTSGTAIPYWSVDGEGVCSTETDDHELRSIALAYLDSRVLEDDAVDVDVRGRRVSGLVVPYHLRSDAPPCEIGRAHV
jgi:aminomethyltransferase